MFHHYQLVTHCEGVADQLTAALTDNTDLTLHIGLRDL